MCKSILITFNPNINCKSLFVLIIGFHFLLPAIISYLFYLMRSRTGKKNIQKSTKTISAKIFLIAFVRDLSKELIKRSKDSNGKREEKAEESSLASLPIARAQKSESIPSARDRSPVTITLLLSRKRVKPCTNSPNNKLLSPPRSSGGIRADIDLSCFSSSPTSSFFLSSSR